MENRMERREESSMMPQARRPLGVTIIAILVGIEGVFEVLAGILLIVATNALGNKAIQHGHTITSRVVDTLGIGLGVVILIIGIITLIFVVGLWTLRAWAYWAVIIVEVITLIPNVLALVRGTGTVVGDILPMIIPVVVLLYFIVDSNVRRAFRI